MVDDVKSRLLAWLNGGDLNTFRFWFAEVVKQTKRDGGELESLVNAVGMEFARFASGDCSEEELRKNLRELASLGRSVAAVVAFANPQPELVLVRNFVTNAVTGVVVNRPLLNLDFRTATGFQHLARTATSSSFPWLDRLSSGNPLLNEDALVG